MLHHENIKKSRTLTLLWKSMVYFADQRNNGTLPMTRDDFNKIVNWIKAIRYPGHSVDIEVTLGVLANRVEALPTIGTPGSIATDDSCIKETVARIQWVHENKLIAQVDEMLLMVCLNCESGTPTVCTKYS
jgi:hypothetical protein